MVVSQVGNSFIHAFTILSKINYLHIFSFLFISILLFKAMSVNHVLEPLAVIVQIVMTPLTQVLNPHVKRGPKLDCVLEIRPQNGGLFL